MTRRIMPLIVEKRVFALLATHLSTHFGLLSVRSGAQLAAATHT